MLKKTDIPATFASFLLLLFLAAIKIAKIKHNAVPQPPIKTNISRNVFENNSVVIDHFVLTLD